MCGNVHEGKYVSRRVAENAERNRSPNRGSNTLAASPNGVALAVLSHSGGASRHLGRSPLRTEGPFSGIAAVLPPRHFPLEINGGIGYTSFRLLSVRGCARAGLIFLAAGGTLRPLPARSGSRGDPPRAQPLGQSLVPLDRRKPSARDGDGERGPGNPDKDLGMYATAYSLYGKLRQSIQSIKAGYGVALRDASHVACLLIMFTQWRLAMPSIGRENVRHATRFFCAPWWMLPRVKIRRGRGNGRS